MYLDGIWRAPSDKHPHQGGDHQLMIKRRPFMLTYLLAGFFFFFSAPKAYLINITGAVAQRIENQDMNNSY